VRVWTGLRWLRIATSVVLMYLVELCHVSVRKKLFRRNLVRISSAAVVFCLNGLINCFKFIQMVKNSSSSYKFTVNSHHRVSLYARYGLLLKLMHLYE
jgi:hypothetical protein